MTTVVADARLGVLGADTFVSTGYSASKIWRCSRGIFGCAGDDPVIAQFETWIQKPKSKRPVIAPTEEFQALQLIDGALFIWGTALRRERVLAHFHAIGSGGPYAMGAMEKGASVQEALRIAAKFDGGTKEPFEFLREDE